MTIQIILTAFSLATDAFAVSVTNGLCHKKMNPLHNSLASGITFGLFQAIMPLIGFLIGNLFKEIAEGIDHWIALILLGIIGGKMIYDSLQKNDEAEACPTEFSLRTLILQGIATSIDALAVGIGFSMVNIDITSTCIAIGVVTFACSFVGVQIGRRFGMVLNDKAQLIGGVVLVLIGINIFAGHIFV